MDRGGSGRGKNHSGMTKIHAQVLGRMLVPIAKEGEGAVLRTAQRTDGKTHNITSSGTRSVRFPAREKTH